MLDRTTAGWQAPATCQPVVERQGSTGSAASKEDLEAAEQPTAYLDAN